METWTERLFPATAMPDRDWWQALWPDPGAIVRSLGMEAGMNVIDLGCGDGYFTAAIARRVRTGKVVGIDLDPALLNEAKAACAGLENCELQLGDVMELGAMNLPAADYVLIANTFHGVPDKTALAREVAKCLRSGGRFAIVNWYPILREQTRVLGQLRGPRTELRMSVEQTEHVVEPAGFTSEKLVKLPPYHYGAVFRKLA